jgi:hypothetical protein
MNAKGAAESSAADQMARPLLCLALLAGCLRFLWLGEWSLWIDEALMLSDAKHGVDRLKPLSYLLFDQIYSLGSARPDEWLLRMPAALFGFLCVPALYWTAWPLVGRKPAALAALVLALAPWQIYWAQNARYYTMLQLLALLGCGGLLRGLASGSLGWACFGGLAFVAAMATHPSVLILGVALVIAILGCRFFSRASGFAVGAHNRRLWLIFLLLCLLAPLGLLPYVDEVRERWTARQGHGDPIHLVKSAAYWFTPMVCLGALWSCLGLLRSRENLILVFLPCAGFAVALLATYFFRVAAQYIFVLFPFFAILAVLPLCRSLDAGGAGDEKRRSLAYWGYGLLLFLPLLLEDGLYFGLRGGDRPNWREAYAHVMEQREEQDLVYAMEAPVGRYYWEPLQTDLRSGGSFTILDSWSAKLPEDWRRYGRRMWFIVNRDQTNDWSREDQRRVLSMLDEQCTLEAHFEVPYTPRDLDLWVYLFRPDWEAQRGLTPAGE